MKKQSTCGLLVILLLSILCSCSSPKLRLLKKTAFPNYPSASSLEYHNGSIYMLGDDAANVLILDTEHQVIDSIFLFKSTVARIAKAEKADFESSFLFSDSGRTYLVAIGSLSTPKRNQLAWVNLATKRLEKTTFANLKSSQITAPNIEGATMINDRVILANRANPNNRKNFILVMSATFQARPNTTGVNVIDLYLPTKGGAAGVSSIYYHKDKDLLLFTASTESTPDAYSDGAIGESYVGVIKSISKKLNRKSIEPDAFIPLSSYLSDDTPQKIESVVVEKSEDDTLTLHLAADNDDGKSTLFKLRWEL